MVHPFFSQFGRPAVNGAFFFCCLPGQNDQFSFIHIWLQHFHGTAEKELAVVIVRGAGKQFQMVRPRGMLQVEGICDVLPLQRTYHQ